MKRSPQAVGAMLRRWRLRAGLTQADVAYALGYSVPQFCSNWERGTSQPPPKAILPLSRILKVPARDIVDLLHAHEVWKADQQREVMMDAVRESRA